MSEPLPLLIAGTVGSPYTRKLKAVLSYRRIPYQFLLTGMPGQTGRSDLPKPPLPLLPCLYVPEADGSYRAASDTTFLIRELEALHSERSVFPTDPVVAMLSSLIEDYADEWVTKQMFHYRWGIEECVDHASNVLPLWNLGISDEVVAGFRDSFGQRQIDRLSGVVAGSIEVTGPIIEASYERLITILRDRLTKHLFVLGGRPSNGDFGLYGQLTQLMQVEPASMAVARSMAPRVMAWVDVMDDLSGMPAEVSEGDWLNRENLGDDIGELLGEIGRTYTPFMLANSAALEAGDEQMTCQIDGQKYWQKPFGYQHKCLGWLRDDYAALTADDRKAFDALLSGTGCEPLFPT